jgi:chloride channel 2
MYGRYTSDLGTVARTEAKRLRLLEKRRRKDDRARKKELSAHKSGKFGKAIGKDSFIYLLLS